MVEKVNNFQVDFDGTTTGDFVTGTLVSSESAGGLIDADTAGDADKELVFANSTDDNAVWRADQTASYSEFSASYSYQTSGSDGHAFSYGLPSSFEANENGASVGLSFSVDDGANTTYIRWNGQFLNFLGYTPPANIMLSASMSVSETGLVLFDFGDGYSTSVQIPGTEWQDTDKSEWDFGLTGRSGSSTGKILMDDLSVSATYTPNYVVEGDGVSTVIDSSYTGDSQGDQIGAGDARDGSNADVVRGSSIAETIITGDGDDIAHGSGGNDTIFGGA